MCTLISFLLFSLQWFSLSVAPRYSLFLSLCFCPLSCTWCEQSSDFSDISESAADYFSRSNRRGSIVSDLDDLSIPDLDTVSCQVHNGVPRSAVQHEWCIDCFPTGAWLKNNIWFSTHPTVCVCDSLYISGVHLGLQKWTCGSVDWEKEK